MSTEDKQNQKGIFAKLCKFFNWFEGPGCACSCFKREWERYAKEEAKKDNQEKPNHRDTKQGI
jgi:hypothetical protein